MSPMLVFAFASIASGLAGISAYLKSNPDPKIAPLVTSFMNSGLLGLAMSLIWLRSFSDNVYSLIGLCVLIGLLGASGQEFALSLLTKSGLTIDFRPKKDKDEEVKK